MPDRLSALLSVLGGVLSRSLPFSPSFSPESGRAEALSVLYPPVIPTFGRSGTLEEVSETRLTRSIIWFGLLLQVSSPSTSWLAV